MDRHSPPAPSVQKQRAFLTKNRWLDLFLGLPVGFVVGFVCFLIVSIASQALRPPPVSDRRMWLDLATAAVLDVLICVVIIRKYPLIGVAMVFGSAVLFLFLFIFSLMPRV